MPKSVIIIHDRVKPGQEGLSLLEQVRLGLADVGLTGDTVVAVPHVFADGTSSRAICEAGVDPSSRLTQGEMSRDLIRLDDLSLPPRLVILHVNNKQSELFYTELCANVAVIRVTSGGEDFAGLPSGEGFQHNLFLPEILQRLEYFPAFIKEWKTHEFDRVDLISSWKWASRTTLLHERKQLDYLLVHLLTLDLVLQGFLAIYSRETPWVEVRNLVPAPAGHQKTECGDEIGADTTWLSTRRPVRSHQAAALSAESAEGSHWFDPVGKIDTQPLPFSSGCDHILQATAIYLPTSEQRELQRILGPDLSVEGASNWAAACAAGQIGNISCPGALRLCWELARGRGKHGEFDATAASRDKLCLLFAAATAEYEAASRLLSQAYHHKFVETSPEKLERKRSIINHDLLRNGFLERLGTAHGTVDDNPDKVALILRAWCHLNSDEQPGSQAAHRSVTEALKHWAQVRHALQNFLQNVPRECKMTVTPRFEKIRQECLDDSAGWIAVIDRFMADFDRLAKSDPEVQHARLRQFWHAADAIHEALSAMRPRFGGEGPRFGDFFQVPAEEVHSPDRQGDLRNG